MTFDTVVIKTIPHDFEPRTKKYYPKKTTKIIYKQQNSL